jgi:hypothetical protein
MIITARYAFLRMVRSVPGLVVYLVLPLFIIPLLGSVFSWVPADTPFFRGAANTMTFFAAAMLVMFQLFGGNYGMQGVSTVFLTPRKWRIHALPCRPVSIVLGILLASTSLSLAQGLLLAGFSELILGARFGSFLVVAIVIFGIALLSQLIGLAILLAIRSTVGAFVLAWTVAYGSAVLGGIIFPLPAGNPFFTFTSTWGTPFSLAQTALLESSRGGAPGRIALCIAILFGASAVFACLAALAGRRKLS